MLFLVSQIVFVILAITLSSLIFLIRGRTVTFESWKRRREYELKRAAKAERRLQWRRSAVALLPFTALRDQHPDRL